MSWRIISVVPRTQSRDSGHCEAAHSALVVALVVPAPESPDPRRGRGWVITSDDGIEHRIVIGRDCLLTGAAQSFEFDGMTHEIKPYPGVDHAFFKDTGGRYSPEQAAAAYTDVLAWLGRQLAG